MNDVDGTLLRYELFVFDLDGTLISSKDLMICALRHCYVAAGRTEEPAFEHFFSLMGCPLDQIFREIGLPVSLADEYRRYSSTNIASVRLYREVTDAIHHLNQIGKQAAINTGKDQARTVEILDAFGLSAYFQIIVASDNVARGKPHPDGLQRILRQLDVPAKAAVMVGDSQMDMECARRAGMDGALALWDSDARGSSLTYQSNWRFDTAESFQRAVGYLPIYS